MYESGNPVRDNIKIIQNIINEVLSPKEKEKLYKNRFNLYVTLSINSENEILLVELVSRNDLECFISFKHFYTILDRIKKLSIKKMVKIKAEEYIRYTFIRRYNRTN